MPKTVENGSTSVSLTRYEATALLSLAISASQEPKTSELSKSILAGCIAKLSRRLAYKAEKRS